MIRKSLLLLLCLLVIGCQGFVPFIGPLVQLGIAWKDGEARKYYASPAADPTIGVKKAAGDLGMEVVSSDGLDLKLKISGHVLHVRIVAVNEKVSLLKVRVDVMGDKPMAELLYKHVDKYNKEFTSHSELEAALKK